MEQLNNQIASYQEQIQQLESEKADADADQQLSYTTQIQSLQTDIDKAQYDIKVKNIALQKQQNAIDNAKVTAEMDGIVKTVKTPEAMQADGTDVIMTITASGNYRIKGTLSEQQLGMVSTGEKMVIRSRLTLLDIVATPISPELIPADENGNIKQKTEDLVGPYELHDFFLYHFLRFGSHPSKIYFLAQKAFAGTYDNATIKKWLYTFFLIFFRYTSG